MVNPSEGDGSGLTAAVLATVPGVERVGRLDAAMVVSPGPTTIQSFDESPVLLVPSGGVGDDFHRPIVDTGRLPDPAEVEEIFVERWWADANDVEVGDRIPMTALTSDDMGTAYEAVDSGAEIPQMGTPIEFTVVGIGGNEGSIAYNADFEPLPWIGTPAYWDRYDEPSAGFGIFPVQLEAGVSAEDLRRGISDLDLRIPEKLEANRRRWQFSRCRARGKPSSGSWDHRWWRCGPSPESRSSSEWSWSARHSVGA